MSYKHAYSLLCSLCIFFKRWWNDYRACGKIEWRWILTPYLLNCRYRFLPLLLIANLLFRLPVADCPLGTVSPCLGTAELRGPLWLEGLCGGMSGQPFSMLERVEERKAGGGTPLLWWEHSYVSQVGQVPNSPPHTKMHMLGGSGGA